MGTVSVGVGNMKNIWILFCVGVISFVDIVPATLSTWQDRVVRNPTNYKALYNLGVAACHEGDYEQADKAWDCVLQLPQVQKLTHQHKEELFYNAGNVAVLRKKYDKGREYFEKVVACNPQHEKAQQKLAYLRQLEEESSSNKENEEKQNTSADDHQDTGDHEEQEKSGEEGKSSSTSSDNKQRKEGSDSQQETSNENKDQASSSDSGGTDTTKEQSSSAGKEEKMSSDSKQSEQEHARDEETTEQESAAGAQEAGQQQAKNQKQTEENHDVIDSHTAKTAAEQAGHDQNDSQAMGAQNNVSEPDLSAYEKDLMAALESYDKNMHKHYMEGKISGMAGSDAEHNW